MENETFFLVGFLEWGFWLVGFLGRGGDLLIPFQQLWTGTGFPDRRAWREARDLKYGNVDVEVSWRLWSRRAKVS